MSRFQNNMIATVSRTRTFFKDFFQLKSRLLPGKESRSKSFGEYDLVEPWAVTVSERSVPSSIRKPSYAESSVPSEGLCEPEIKSRYQIERMRRSCVLARRVLGEAGRYLKAGVTTDQLDERLHRLIVENGAYPSPLNYRGFPKSICTSVNNVACHGIPDNRPLRCGDTLNVDVTVFLNGYHGDCSAMFEIGEVDGEGRRLIGATEACLARAISICKPNENFSSIGNIVEETAREHGYGVVPAFAGHGIGDYFHGPPDIHHFANDYAGKMQAGMTFTIEPVLTQGGPDVVILEDGWTAVTADDARTAQIEHTVLITDTGYEILTR